MPTPLPGPIIKVCGLTRESDVRAAASCGVNTIGLNLVSRSPRYLARERAAELAAVAKELKLTVVAVLMDPATDEVEDLARRKLFDVIQFHGHEPVELANACRTLPVIKALSWSGRAEERALALEWSCLYSAPHQIQDTSQSTQVAGDGVDIDNGVRDPEARAASESTGVADSNRQVDGQAQLAAFLVDAHAPGVGGGTGRLADWQRLSPSPPELAAPIILAGGLKPDNVAAGIAATRCFGVDTASGVEESPGIKSAELMKRFAENARRAFRDPSS